MPEIDFDWQEEVERDLDDAALADEWEGWISPLQSIGVDDRWAIELSQEYIKSLKYSQIQSDGNDRFDEYWEEKMKRQRDGIK